MTGKNMPQELITPEEAWRLFEYSSAEAMFRTISLCHIFVERDEKTTDLAFNFYSLLAFCYDTGRCQGIREERAKRKP